MTKTVLGMALSAVVAAGCGSGVSIDGLGSEVATRSVGSALSASDATGSGSCGTSGSGDGGLLSCNAETGLSSPLAVCSPSQACCGEGNVTLTAPIALPSCVTSSATRPYFDDGPPVQWADAVSGDPRAACEYLPPTASAAAPVPLIVFLHGSQGSADDVYNQTSLRSKAPSYQLPGAAGPGFALVAVQGQNLHYTVGGSPDGPHWDEFYHDLGSPSTNPDVRAIDLVIDTLVATHKIDQQRIYLMGWSNGAFMSQEYGVARLNTPTQGGNQIAAVAIYAGADPFDTYNEADPVCAVSPYPHSGLPIAIVHRDCDAEVGCDLAQETKFGLKPGFAVEDWLTFAATSTGLADQTLDDVLIDGRGKSVTACQPSVLCTDVIGVKNHLSWPDGVSDGSGNDWEPTMLSFLASHPG